VTEAEVEPVYCSPKVHSKEQEPKCLLPSSFAE
jgi:hypothetical protein